MGQKYYLSRDLRLPFFVAYIATCIVVSISHANEESELLAFTEKDLFADIPEVVSATRLSQLLTESPTAMTVIDRQTIENSNALYITDLFRFVPGMQSYSVTHNKHAVGYHGLSDDFPNRLEVMLDGRSIYLPLLSTVTWETMGISLDDIERIEVVRGSNVPSQGSNAFLGSINIITRSPLDGAKNSARVTTGYRGERRVETRINNINKFGEISLSTGYTTNDGSEHFEDDATNRYVNIKALSSPTLNDTIEVQIGASHGVTSILEGDIIDGEVSDRAHDTNHQYAVWTHTSSDNHEYKVTAYRNYVDLDVGWITAEEWLVLNGQATTSNASAVATAFGVNGGYFRPDTEHGVTELYDVELQHTYLPDERFNLITGMGYRHEYGQSDILLDSDDWIDESRLRLFSNAQWHSSENTTWNLGAMHEHTSNTGGRLSPRVGVNYQLSPESTLRFAQSRAYRAPSLLDANFAYNIRRTEANGGAVVEQQWRVNDNLKPERIDTSEIGFYMVFPDSHTHLDLRVFHERVTDAIATTFADIDPSLGDVNNYVLTRDNAQKWRANGFEAQLSSRPTDYVDMSLTYGYINAFGLFYKNPSTNYTGVDPYVDLAPYAPKHTGSASLVLGTPTSGQFGITQTFIAEANWLEGSGNKKRNPFNRTDVQVRKRFPLSATKDGEIKLIVQNLFDQRYSEFYEYNYFDRRAYLQLKLLF
ncbi:MAG: TonB-dependent receptor plug domain-containing protein [Pontibacterium sp.]